MDVTLFIGLDIFAIVLFALSLVYLTKEEKYEDPGVLPVFGLLIFSVIFLTFFTVFDLFGYAGAVSPFVANAWKDVTLALAGLCFFIAAFMTKQLSDIIA